MSTGRFTLYTPNQPAMWKVHAKVHAAARKLEKRGIEGWRERKREMGGGKGERKWRERMKWRKKRDRERERERRKKRRAG